MSKKALEEIRGKDDADLRTNLTDLRKEQFELRFHGASETVAKTSRHHQIRRSIARIMTVLGERERKARSGQVTGGQK